jgi:alkanesulfonate monooxygenase SsuD/methylene tetrahydromethanopterin reductase-like flavin-dependent oxidoreductase (luciferase family)
VGDLGAGTVSTGSADRRQVPWGVAMSADRIVMGATASPEPDRAWLEAAEKLPIEAIWHGGHVMPPINSGEAIVRTSLVAAWTERVRIGTSILLLPLYQPALVAKQLADIDSFSGGRLTVGIGVGGEYPTEFDAVGVPVAERGARTDEAVQVMRALWAGGPTSFHGRFSSFDDVELRPVTPPGATVPAMTSGGPPIVVSGRKAPAMRRAARHGEGWMPYLVTPNAYARSVDAVRAEADAIGRDLDGFEWMLYLYCSIRADGDRAREEAAAGVGRTYANLPAEVVARIVPAGTPDEVAVGVQAFVDAGARHVIVVPTAKVDTLEVVRLAAEEVLPQLTLPST